jgi:hypothetical protein
MKSLALGMLAVSVCAVPDGDRTRPLESRDLNRFLFFAVLEGLIVDGVPDETVARVLEQKDGRYVNFVYACGICGPTIEALKAYALREEFYYARKGDPLVGKAELPAGIARLLAHSEAVKRREGIERLVNRYVERRFQELRYTEAESKPVRLALEEAKKRGGVMSPEQQADLKECPSCKGAAVGSLLR